LANDAFLFYGDEVFGIPKLTAFLYIFGLAAGFIIWGILRYGKG